MTPCALGVALFASADSARNYTLHATRLHAHLLAGYNTMIPPVSRRQVNYSSAGTDVMLNMRFWKVDAVEVAAGRMRVKVWVRFKWQDERLAWDPAEFGGITTLPLNAEEGASDIWLPDLAVYNTNEGLRSSMDPALARANHAGLVVWNRPGMFDVLCRFSGLVMFPFDELSCPIELGGWVTSGTTQGLLPDPDSGCVDATHNEEVSMSSYTEYLIREVTCEAEVLEYASFPGVCVQSPADSLHVPTQVQRPSELLSSPSDPFRVLLSPFPNPSEPRRDVADHALPRLPRARQPLLRVHCTHPVRHLRRALVRRLLHVLPGRGAPRHRGDARADDRGVQGHVRADDPRVRRDAVARDLLPRQLPLHGALAISPRSHTTSI